MKEIILKNVVTVVVLIVSIAIAWGVIRSDVVHNAHAITANAIEIRANSDEIVEGRVTRQEILTKLSYIEALLLELRDK